MKNDQLVYEPQIKLWGLSLIIAPLIFGISTFFWQNGEYGVNGGTMLAVATIFWILAFMGLFDLLKEKSPRYATWGLLIAIAGCISGANFGFVGVYSEVFNISHQNYIQQLSKYPVSANILLFWSGPLFPLSLLVLGIMLGKTRSVPLWVAISISVAAILFPLSRIPRIEWIAHLADGLLMVPLAFTGWKYLFKNNSGKISVDIITSQV